LVGEIILYYDARSKKPQITFTDVFNFRLAFAIMYSSVTGFFDREKLLDLRAFTDIKITWIVCHSYGRHSSNNNKNSLILIVLNPNINQQTHTGKIYFIIYCVKSPTCFSCFCSIIRVLYINVKESCNRAGVAQRVQGGLGSQISGHEGGEVVSLTHRPPLPPGMFLVLIFTRGWVVMVRSEGICHWKIQ